jgi:hypothetical protein
MTGEGWATGFDAVLAHCDEQRARQEKAVRAAQERASNHRDPGRPISTTLLPHVIPEHVNAAIAKPTWGEGEGQDQTRLFKRLVRDVAHPLLLRGYIAEEFIAFMPDYVPPPIQVWRGGERVEAARENVLWEEITTRGRRARYPGQYEPMIAKAFKYAEENIGRGVIPDSDQPAYITALIDLWRGAAGAGRVRLTRCEAGILDYVMHQMRARGFLNVTCPSREVARAVGADNHLAVWRALKHLADDGVLICRSKGVALAGRAAIYCLSPQIQEKRCLHPQTPATTGSKRQRPERTRGSEKHASHGTSPSLKPVKPLVKPYFDERQQVKHTYSLRGKRGISDPHASPGSIGMFHPLSGAGVRLVSDQDLDPPAELVADGPAAVEDYYARLWGAWAVLWPGRWPKAPHLPHGQLVVMESAQAAQMWVRTVVLTLGRGKSSPASSDAQAGLQLWLASQLERHRWRAAYQATNPPPHPKGRP